MLTVTGATGKLGQLVISKLLETTPADKILAIVRDREKAKLLLARGVIVREGDYTKPETLVDALIGTKRLLLISSKRSGRESTNTKTLSMPREELTLSY